MQYISLKLPDNLKLLTSTDLDKIYIYYSIVKVHGIGISSKITLFIELPLKSSDKYFELYQIHTLPFFDRNLTKFVKIYQKHQYLASAKDRQTYMYLNNDDLLKYITGEYTICPADSPVYSRHVTCLISIFLENVKGIQQSCWKVILPDDFSPVFNSVNLQLVETTSDHVEMSENRS